MTKTFADKLREKLKTASKGEPSTWGFVAAFMGMIDEVEKETATKIRTDDMDPKQALANVAEAIKDKEDIFHDSWNLDAHIEVTLTIAEARGLVNLATSGDARR